jgi:hypothetical protein
MTRRHRRSARAAFLVAVAAIGLTACGGPSPHNAAGLPKSSGTGKPSEAVGVASQDAGVAIDPAYFSPGACVAFPPTAGNRHLTVFLDAGHGGPDPGAVGITESGRVIYEADQTLPVVLDTMAILRRAGFRVVVSRTGPTSVIRLGPGDVSGHRSRTPESRPIRDSVRRSMLPAMPTGTSCCLARRRKAISARQA